MENIKALKKIEVFLSIIIVVILTLIIGVNTVHAEMPASGNCGVKNSNNEFGDNATYTYNSATHALVVEGSGAIGEDVFGEMPSEDKDLVTSIEIRNGIEVIDQNAFNGLQHVTSISLPSTLKEIRYRAFYNLFDLSNVNLPSSLLKINSEAFYNSNISTIDIPESVNKMSWDSFGKEDSQGAPVSKLIIRSKNIEFEQIMTSGNSQGKFTNNIKTAGPIGGNYDYEFAWTSSIPAYAFQYTEGLTSVNIPSTISSIGQRAFANTTKLSDVTILDPDCEIYDSSDTFANNTILKGYTGSTTEKYANKYSKTFASLGEPSYTTVSLVDIGNVWRDFNPNIEVPFTGEINPNEPGLTDIISLEEEKWESTDGEHVISSLASSKPKVGKTYKYTAVVRAKSGYIFGESFDFVYGGTAYDYSDLTVERSENGKTVSITGFVDDVKVNGIDLSKGSVSGITNKTFTGKNQTQNIVVKLGSTTLKNGTDYKVTYNNNKNAGTATLTIQGIGNYSGKITKTFKINKANQNIKVSTSNKTVKYKKVKKKKQIVKTIAVNNAKGKVVYSKVSGNKKITIDKNTGKVTIKKNTKKGTYKIKVKVTSGKTNNYNSQTKTVTFKVKIK